MTEIQSILNALTAHPGEPAALATLVSLEGSSYRRPGARLLLVGDDRLGSISGGCLEDDIIARARRVIASGVSELATYDTTSENDIVWGVGLGCQGIVRVLLEPVPALRPAWLAELATNRTHRRSTELAVVHGGTPSAKWGTCLARELPATMAGAEIFRETIAAPPELLLCGAGDDAQPLVRIAQETGWHVTVVDSRSAYANRLRFPTADAIETLPSTELVSSLSPGPLTFAVVMTHRYTEDAKLLQQLLPLSLAYLGVLGPRKRTDRLLAELESGGMAITPATRARLHAPIGLDLGGTTPETVALAIVAEMQSRLAGRIPGHLRDRPGPIHD